MKNKSIVLHPIYLVALGLLILNDHILKAIYPSLLTGKISDFTGLFVFIVFIQSFFQLKIKSFLIISAFSLTIFSILKMFSFGIFDLYLPIITKDKTDLIALLIIFPTYLYLFRINFDDKFALRKISPLIIVISCFGIIATSPPPKALYPGETDYYSEFPIIIDKKEFVIQINEINVLYNTIHADIEIENKLKEELFIASKYIFISYTDSTFYLDGFYYDDELVEELKIQPNDNEDIRIYFENDAFTDLFFKNNGTKILLFQIEKIYTNNQTYTLDKIELRTR